MRPDALTYRPKIPVSVAEKALGRSVALGRVLYPDLYRRRALARYGSVWAVMAGKQKAPGSENPGAFTESTTKDGRNGCSTDGA
jgi:hypothetical protein